MGNMLFWLAVMHVGDRSDKDPASAAGDRVTTAIRYFAFWCARLQLLVVYAATAAHKFSGSTWLDGSALSIVATDQDFHLTWLDTIPALAHIITYATLVFCLTFPLAIW